MKFVTSYNLENKYDQTRGIFEFETYFILELGLCLCGISKKASHTISNLAFYLIIYL